MSTLAYIILFTLIGSVFSLVGGIALLFKEKFAIKISHFLSAFAAGALLATSFLDLLPESLEHAREFSSDVNVFLWALGGIIIFFLLERFVHWFHHAHTIEHKEPVKPTVPLIMFGDSIHNFIDGVAIAATFMISIPLGIITTFAVAAHEIPQEIGDFGVLLRKGVRRRNVLLFNLFSALTAVLGAVLTYFIGNSIEAYLPHLLALTAGFFIYIALSDLIPEIHHENRKGFATWESVMLILGIVIVYILVSLLEHGQ